MALLPQQLHANAVIEVDGERGRVIQTDATMTYVERESGKIEVYSTGHVTSEANMPEELQPDTESPEQARIAELENELAALRSGPTAFAPAPGGTPETTQPAQNESPQTGVPESEPGTGNQPESAPAPTHGESEETQH